jgi:hypothetical protein
MSYDFTIRADPAYSQYKNYNEVKEFLLSQENVAANGDLSFCLNKPPRQRMEIDIEAVTSEGDSIVGEVSRTGSFNCINAHIPYGQLEKSRVEEYLPLLQSLTSHLGWKLVDQQMDDLSNVESVKPWWKFW